MTRYLARHAVTRTLGLLASALTLATGVQAQSIAAIGTEGLSYIAPGGDLYAIYEGGGTGYFNQLFLQDATVPFFTNATTNVGEQTWLGNFAAGTELVFRMNTVDHDRQVYDFYTGSASRNTDGLAHARVQQDWQPDTTLVSFENQLGNPEGDGGFNDMSFSLSRTAVVPPPPPPEEPGNPPELGFVAPPGTEGIPVIAPGGDLYATFEGTQASYQNTLYVNGVEIPIFDTSIDAPGKEVFLGSFTEGTEVVFRMNVAIGGNTLNDFFSGDPTRNIDALAHARVLNGGKDGAILVSFEDQQDNPEGVGGFNDLGFTLRSSSTGTIPEPGTMVLMALGLGLLMTRHRHLRA
jgi:hypothetical protein